MVKHKQGEDNMRNTKLYEAVCKLKDALENHELDEYPKANIDKATKMIESIYALCVERRSR